jgi:hypothetical protein
LDALRVHEVD